MTKLDLIRVLDDIIEQLQAEKFLGRFGEFIDRNDKERLIGLVSQASVWYQTRHTFSDSTKLILDAFKADRHLSRSGFLNLMEDIVSLGESDVVSENGPSGRYAIYLEQMLALKEVLKNTLNIPDDTLLYGDSKGEPSLLAITIVSNEDTVLAGRLIKVIQATVELIEAFGEIYQKSYSTDIVFLDSGSDKLAVFKSGAEITRQILDSLKEYIVMYRTRKIERQKKKTGLLRDDLSFLADIKAQVDAGVLAQETGELLAAKVEKRMLDLLDEGAAPKQLLELEYAGSSGRKLIGEGAQKQLPAAGGDSGSGN